MNSLLKQIKSFVTKKKSKKTIWHVGAWAGNFGDSIIRLSIKENMESLSKYQLDFKYINCQQTEFTEDVIAEMNQEADLLLVGGGGLIFYRPQDNSRSGWQFNIDINLIDKIQVPFVVYGIGYNKFEYDNSDFLPITNEHLKKTVEKATLFSVRNSGTKRELIHRGCDANKIEVIPDSGMFLKAAEITIPGLNNKKLKVGINWTSDRENQTFPEPSPVNREQFIKNLIKVCNYLVNKQNAQIFYIGHMGRDFDKNIIELLREGLGENLLVIDEILPFLYPPDPERAKKLVGVYKQMDLIFGMRGHSNIVAFGQHVPFIPIGSHRKNRYFLEDIGEGKYIFDIREINKQHDEDWMIQIVNGLLAEKDEYLKRHYRVHEKLKGQFDTFNKKVLSLLDKIYEKCPACGGSSDFYMRTNRYEIYRDVVRCRYCQLIYLSPLVKGKEHEQFYDMTYRKLYKCPQYPDEAFHNERIPASIFRMEFINKTIDFKKELALLDIGCGGGTFLMSLKKNGFNSIEGVEIDPNYSSYIEKEIGVGVINKSLEMIHISKQYDIVTMWHVLEHVENINEALSVPMKLLKDDGWLFIEVPLIFDVTNPPKDKVTFQIAHNYYFTEQSLKKVLNRAGFKIEKAEITPMNFYIVGCKKNS